MPSHHLRHHEIAGTMENECAESPSPSFGLHPSELRSPWAISFCLQRVEAPQLAATVPDQQSGKDAENRSNQLI
jgi:hypothetical protein